MVIVKFKYFGIPIAALSRQAQQVELPFGATVEQLLNSISDKADGWIDELIQAATFLVNESKAEKHTVLNDGDEVIIMYTMAGG
jgi:molybdopterin converting factor small subunit